MSTDALTQIERVFSALPRAERETIIRHGVALRMADLNKRLFLAEGKVRAFTERYHTTLEQLDATGLPDDAGIEMHEDYIMWHHWTDVAQQTARDIAALQKIAQHGLLGEVVPDAGD
jgi:hypothetical protein